MCGGHLWQVFVTVLEREPVATLVAFRLAWDRYHTLPYYVASTGFPDPSTRLVGGLHILLPPYAISQLIKSSLS